jgi:glycerophosphoryl diester phosphodiesterase
MAESRLAERFELQGHRGARGLKPENTLPSFEIAIDLGLSSIETDVHLTLDGVPVLCHDPRLGDAIYRLKVEGPPSPSQHPPICQLSYSQLRSYIADRNPDPGGFPNQSQEPTSAARIYANAAGIDPFGIPRLSDLFGFVKAYAGELGTQAGKNEAKRTNAKQICLDLELKRVPFYPQAIGDSFDGTAPALLEKQVVAAIHDTNLTSRCRIRSFDHRSVRAAKDLEPELEAGVIVAATTPVRPSQLALNAGASVYCPDFRFIDQAAVKEAHQAAVRVIPWTVNDPGDWSVLLEWGVDGITTDFPDQLADWLRQRGIPF